MQHAPPAIHRAVAASGKRAGPALSTRARSSPSDPVVALVVSLSGGVDSMVLVHVLLALRAARGYQYAVHAVHIDYGNRVESAAEAAFVQRWCKDRGVSLRVRRVDEVRRGTTARDEYERESRKIRFAEYAAALDACGGARNGWRFWSIRRMEFKCTFLLQLVRRRR